MQSIVPDLALLLFLIICWNIQESVCLQFKIIGPKKLNNGQNNPPAKSHRGSRVRAQIVLCCGRKRCSANDRKILPVKNNTSLSKRTSETIKDTSNFLNSKLVTTLKNSITQSGDDDDGNQISEKDLTTAAQEAEKDKEQVDGQTVPSVNSATSFAPLASVKEELSQQTSESTIEASGTLMRSTLSASGTSLSDATAGSGVTNSGGSTSQTEIMKSSTLQEGNLISDSIVATTTSMASISSSTSSSTTVCPGKCVSFNAIEKAPAGLVAKEFMACGRVYKIITPAMSYSSAVAACIERNYTLLSVHTASEKACIENIKLDTEAWSSGSSEGMECSLPVTWCSSGQAVSAEVVTMTSPGQCLSLQAGSRWAEATCSTKMAAFCEPACETPQCPTPAAVNDTCFTADGKIKSPFLYGTWVSIGGRMYLFGSKLVSWLGNSQMCSALKMAPLTIDDNVEFEALLDYVKSKKNWSLNWNYWTGGAQQGCQGQWANCPSGKPIEDAFWLKGKPDHPFRLHQCAHLQILKNGSAIGLTDRNCSSKYVLACETELSSQSMVKPTCPDSSTCKRNEALFNSDKRIINQYQYGEWFTTCGRHFHFSTKKATFEGAWEACCSFGFSLLDMDKDSKNKCIRRLIERYVPVSKLHHGEFWTSGTDKGSPGNFGWCSSSLPLRSTSVRWRQDHPKSSTCVFLDTTASVDNMTVLATDDCSKEKFFVCERLVRSQSGLGLQFECMDTYGLNLTDLEQVEKGLVDMATVPHRIKCFIKCMGESVGMFLENGLAMDIVARMIEEQEGDISTMEASLNAVDECSSKTADDECVTATQIYKCGLEKNETFVKNLVAEKNFAGDGLQAGCLVERTCSKTFKVPCVKNQTLIDMVIAQGKSFPDGFFVQLNVGRRAYIFYGTPKHQSFDDAYDYCCALGMTLYFHQALPGNPVQEYTDIETVLKANGIQIEGVKFYIGETTSSANQENFCFSPSEYYETGAFAEKLQYNNQAPRMCQHSALILIVSPIKLDLLPRDGLPSEEKVGFLCKNY